MAVKNGLYWLWKMLWTEGPGVDNNEFSHSLCNTQAVLGFEYDAGNMDNIWFWENYHVGQEKDWRKLSIEERAQALRDWVITMIDSEFLSLFRDDELSFPWWLEHPEVKMLFGEEHDAQERERYLLAEKQRRELYERVPSD